MTAHSCRVCHSAPATTLTVFVVDHNGARVEHRTCDRHTEGLQADMLAAGWRIEEPAVAEIARIYLDVDGVLNAVPHGQPDWGYQTAAVNGYSITYSPDLIALINRIAATPGVRVYWLTTWCYDAPNHLCRPLGLDGKAWPVVGYDHWRAATGLPWWKHLAIVEHLDGFDGGVLWIDDDHGVDAACVAWLAGQPQILTIAPDTRTGVTRAEASIIERFAEQLQPSGVDA